MYLGIDLGTSGLRGLLVDASGNPVAESTCSYNVNSPEDGWSEQDPSDWLDAFENVVQDIRNNTPAQLARVEGIGVSGHMHGAVVLDEDRQVIRPCILWNDTRSAKEAARLDGDRAFREYSGNIVFPGFTAPKLSWMANHEPELFERVAHILLPKDYLVYYLTGKLVTEMSDASGTSWLDVGARQWSGELLSKSGITAQMLPDLHEGSDVIGPLSKALAQKIGLSEHVRIVAGGADNACAACGVGAIEDGRGFVSLGTSGVIFLASNAYHPKPETAIHTFCHALPGKWYQMGVTLSATDSLNWLSAVLEKDVGELVAMLPTQATGPGALLFLPYLSGERTPHNNASIRGAFAGLSKSTSQPAMTQAVLEGVGFALRECLDALYSTGNSAKSLIAVGGGSRSQFWLSSLANILDLSIDVPEKGEFGAAMGAARLAMIGAGEMNLSDVMARPEINRTVTPDPGLVQLYENRFQNYKNFYQALEDYQ